MTKKCLNIACGDNKWEGFINIDMNPELKPDLVCDIRTESLPYEDGTVDDIWFCHAIEHIEKRAHPNVVSEFARVLKKEGSLYMSWPDFNEVVSNWQNNYLGKREFWENCVYGRQQSIGDYHVCIVTDNYIQELLMAAGFTDLDVKEEPDASFYHMIKAIKTLEPAFRDSELVQQRA